jgi:Kef-type K+ transport system membrane component KefB
VRSPLIKSVGSTTRGLLVDFGDLVILPKWTTFVIIAAFLVQFVLTWLQAKRSGKRFRSAVLPNALMAVAMSIVFARELFKDTRLD